MLNKSSVEESHEYFVVVLTPTASIKLAHIFARSPMPVRCSWVLPLDYLTCVTEDILLIVFDILTKDIMTLLLNSQ